MGSYYDVKKKSRPACADTNNRLLAIDPAPNGGDVDSTRVRQLPDPSRPLVVLKCLRYFPAVELRKAMALSTWAFTPTDKTDSSISKRSLWFVGATSMEVKFFVEANI